MSRPQDQATREGFSYLQRAEIRDAELKFCAAIAASAANAQALNGLAIIAHQTGLMSARINISSALHAVGRIDEAVLAIERALKYPADSPEIYKNLGNLYKKQGRLQNAITCYSHALRLNPMSPQAVGNRLAALRHLR